ncbi:hypothetical protein Trydic_g22378 [Trypoxylus dichotomus]
MLGELAGKLISKIPLSNNTNNRKIHHIAQDLNDQLIEKMNWTEFDPQLDGATGNKKDTHLYSWMIIVSLKIFCPTKASLEAQRLKTYLRALGSLKPKMIWIGNGTSACTLMDLVNISPLLRIT